VFTLLYVSLKASIDNIPNVHVFGDSHSIACFRDGSRGLSFELTGNDHIFIYNDFKIPFSIHWIVDKTMHGVGKDGLNTLDIKKYNVLENDIVVFVFGEIDVRCHIGRQRDQKKRCLEEIINTLVNNYVATINENRVFYNNINCVIMSVLPPTNRGFNHAFPYYGTIEDRVNITKKLNSKLKEACLLNNIKYLDVYYLYADSNGSFNKALGDQSVHVGLNKNYPIKEALAKLIFL
jgi:hypothetical protein